MPFEERDIFLFLNEIQGLGPRRCLRLIAAFPDLNDIFTSDYETLARTLEDSATAKAIIASRPNAESKIIAARKQLSAEQIDFCTLKDDTYPKLLREIFDPPTILYFRGNDKLLNSAAVAIVGTRKPSKYGEQITWTLARELGQNDLTIISGLALGIDGIAHLGALEVGGATIAVTGSGLSDANIYPVHHRDLSRKIIEQNGLIVSEFSPDTLPLKQNFVRRNRIISGLSKATVVIEAGEKSGALITANFALEQNREVCAVPGTINSPQAQGVNRLIQRGANLITGSQDVLNVLNWQPKTGTRQSPPTFETELEKIIYSLLSGQPQHIDFVIKDSGMSTAEVNAVIVVMEVKGLVRNLGGNMYVKN